MSIGDWRGRGTSRATAPTAPPRAALWATDPRGFGQVGCVYTAQGFEYDWSGVIIGPDLVWRGTAGSPTARGPEGPALSEAADPDDLPYRLIRNTYKVLLTRGMSGTIVYSTDPETQARLRQLVPAPTTAEPDPRAPVQQPT